MCIRDRGNAGYRVGIHMKAYEDHRPVIVIGGKAGDYLGEYQAGGVLIVLGIGAEAVSYTHLFPDRTKRQYREPLA